MQAPALAALILSISAFVVAFLQFLLAYLSSSSSRQKCTRAAIGPSASLGKKRWDFRWWHLQVFYPAMSLRASSLQKVQVELYDNSIKAFDNNLQALANQRNWRWHDVNEYDRLPWYHIADTYYKLLGHNDRTPVTLKDLGFREGIRIMWWKLRHRPLNRSIERPRASWAQVFYAFGIADTKMLKYGVVEADSIPDDVGVAIQRVRLYDLGYIAFLLGFNSVRINIRDREINATSRHAKISTTALLDVGNVARFEGDIFAVHKQMAIGYPRTLQNNGVMIIGRIVFGRQLVSPSFYCPIGMVFEGLREGITNDEFDTRLQNSLRDSGGPNLGWIGLEANTFKEISASQQNFGEYQTQREWMRRGNLGNRIPTLYAALTFASVPATSLGFPSNILICPFMPWLCQRANTILSHRNMFTESKALRTNMATKELNFLRQDGIIWMSKAYRGLDASRGWGGWDHHEIAAAYESCSYMVQGQIIPQLPFPDGYIGPTDVPGIVLFPETLSLLEQFQVREWGESLERALKLSPSSYSPKSMIWAQIMVLDIGIYYLVNGALPDDDHNRSWVKSLAVISAIRQAWVKDRDIPWDLARTIEDERNLFRYIDQDEQRRKAIKLATMLELRAMFYLAFLIIGPDTSDVYTASRANAEISMI